MPKAHRVGRPAAVSPSGYVTISEAMERTGCSYPVVYRHVRDKLVRFIRDPGNGSVIFIRSEDLGRIKKHEPPPDRPRVPVQLSPVVERHRAWARVAKTRKTSVTGLAYELLDHAAGYDATE